MDRRKRSSRAAFTLIEVLVVVLIIGILVALLVPAIVAAVRTAREAQVTAEINNLSTALTSFKQLYNDFPPSRVIICEAGFNAYLAAHSSTLNNPVGPSTSDGLDTDLTYAQLIARSQIYLSRFWPRTDFNNGTIPFDINNNGSTTDVLILSGSECLTFFLGGIPINNGNGTYSMSGFSKSPVNPFQNSVAQTNRVVPMYEFVASRLIDQDGDLLPAYIDPLNTTPGSRRSYAYFSSYGSNSYDPNDVNGYGRISDGQTTLDDAADFEADDDATGTTSATFTEWGFLVGFPLASSSATTPSNMAVSPAPNPYTSGPSYNANGSVAWVNPTSYQILCSGQDGFWGPGGTYAGKGGGAILPIYPKTATAPSTQHDPGNVNDIRNRVRENDNLTNFSGGRIN